MKVSKTTALLFATMMTVSTPSFAGSDDVGFGDVLNTINNVASIFSSDTTNNINISGAKTFESYNSSHCDATGQSVCQDASGVSVDQISVGQGRDINNLQIGYVHHGKAANNSTGSASGNSTRQSAAGATVSQMATR